jgi:hypothetical protein
MTKIGSMTHEPQAACRLGFFMCSTLCLSGAFTVLRFSFAQRELEGVMRLWSV